MRLCLALVLLAACSRGDSRDCDQVRKAIDGVPRRYQDESVAKLSLSDPELSKAARAGDASALKGLCKIVSTNARAEDCGRLRMVVPTTGSEKERVGVFDPELAKSKHYEDPEIKALVKELEDSGWLPFAPAGTPPNPRVAKLRALCKIP